MGSNRAASLFIAASASMLFCAAASAAQAPAPKPLPDHPQPEESTQHLWDSDVEDASEVIRKLKLKLAARELRLAVKEHETTGLQAMLHGDLAAARREYEAALQLDPTDFDNRLYLAGILGDSGDRQGSIAAYGQVLEQGAKWMAEHPEDKAKVSKMLARVHGDRGVAYMMLPDKKAEALADFEAAIKDHPRPSLMLWQKAQVLIDLKRFKEAGQVYAEAAAKDAGIKKLPGSKNLCEAFAQEGLTNAACQ
ncbi:MAG: hypothetical protein AAB320_07495 [Elusimicrobiota bacterium]